MGIIGLIKGDTRSLDNGSYGIEDVSEHLIRSDAREWFPWCHASSHLGLDVEDLMI